VDWNEAAEEFLNRILNYTPRPEREATERELRATADALAEEDGKQRVNVETVIAAWVRTTPEVLRADLPRQMERFGLDPEEYRTLWE
jgi:Proto-chlorophyllide reductase 57 kD subunit